MSKKWIGVAVVAVALGIGAVAGYQWALVQDADAPVAEDPVSVPKPDTAEPEQQEPAPTTPEPSPAEPDQTGQTGTQTPVSDVIAIRTAGSTSLTLTDKGIQNDGFQIDRLEWAESTQTLYVVGKMRAFEAAGYMRVRDADKNIIEPERVIYADGGAPAWGAIKGAIPLLPEHKGTELWIEFYQKSPNDGSKMHILKFRVRPE